MNSFLGNPEGVRLGATRLRLQDFRNYTHAELVLDDGLNVLHGLNAQGKTNLLEACFVLATSRLLRGQRDHEAIREGSDRMLVEADLLNGATTLAVSLERGGRKKALLNGISLPRAADLLGRMPCVCVSVLDLETVRGEPAERRMFLDLELSGLYPSYLRHLAGYRRCLEQRNALLRTAREQSVAESAFEVWEVPIGEHGAALRSARRQYLAQLAQPLQELQAILGQGERFEALDSPCDESEGAEALTALLASTRAHDVARGSTSVGPHRDDVNLLVDGKSVRLFGSQGQQRTAAISLKLASLRVAREVLGGQPMLLLDDIFSDLDAFRRETLVQIVLEHGGQTILTCTEPSLAGEDILRRAKLFRVERGTVREA